MKALPRLDIFKVRQLKGAPRTTQDTIEPGGGERFGPKILQIPGQEKGYFVVIFVLQQRRQQGGEGGWQWAKQTTDARARGDSQVSAANYRRPGQLYTRCSAWLEGVGTFYKGFCVHNQPRTGYTVVSVKSSMIVQWL